MTAVRGDDPGIEPAPFKTRLRAVAEIALVHAALVLALWLFAILVYALALAPSFEPLWLAVDAALIALALGVAYRWRERVGFTALGPRRFRGLAATGVVATACVLVVQLVVVDWNMVALDETNYLMTLREERIIADGLLPFNIRWLVPFFAGPWNILPVADMVAIKAINFGAFVVTAAGLILLLVRLRVPLWLAVASPVFLLSSYLGVYGASNRLVLDPANYALYVLLFHALLRREHWPYFSILLFVDALNAEKAVYWIPVFVLVQLLRMPRWSKRELVNVLRVSAYCLAPTLLYFLVLWMYLAPSRLEANLCFENLHQMAFTNLGGTMPENVRRNGMHSLWFPFGPMTVYALLGFALSPVREIKPVVLLVLPIFVQALIACDTDRMLAYSFVVYVPFGFLYLARAFTDMPRPLAIALFATQVTLAAVGHYLWPVLALLDLELVFRANAVKMWLGGFEVLLVGAIVFVHFTVYARRASSTVGV